MAPLCGDPLRRLADNRRGVDPKEHSSESRVNSVVRSRWVDWVIRQRWGFCSPVENAKCWKTL